MTRRRDLYDDWGERQRRAAVVRAHRQEYGDLCPGYGRPAHPSADLCADHVHEVGVGGDPRGRLQVLCRGCNSRKRNVVQAQHRQQQRQRRSTTRVINSIEW